MTPWLKEQLESLKATTEVTLEAYRRGAAHYWPHVDPEDVSAVLDASGVIGLATAVHGLNNLERELARG